MSDFPPLDWQVFEERRLEKQHFNLRKILSSEVIHKHEYLEAIHNRMIYELSAHVYAEKLLEDEAKNVPVSFEYEYETAARPWWATTIWFATAIVLAMGLNVVALIYFILGLLVEATYLFHEPKTVKATAHTTVDIGAEHWVYYPDMPQPAMDYGTMKVAVRQIPNFMEM